MFRMLHFACSNFILITWALAEPKAVASYILWWGCSREPSVRTTTVRIARWFSSSDHGFQQKQNPVTRFGFHSLQLIWCRISFCAALANGCRRLAGQCTKADSLAFASCPIEEHEHKTPAVRPCAMHECLTRKTSSIEISIQVAQLLHTGLATSIDRIERYEQSSKSHKSIPSRQLTIILKWRHSPVSTTWGVYDWRLREKLTISSRRSLGRLYFLSRES